MALGSGVGVGEGGVPDGVGVAVADAAASVAVLAAVVGVDSGVSEGCAVSAGARAADRWPVADCGSAALLASATWLKPRLSGVARGVRVRSAAEMGTPQATARNDVKASSGSRGRAAVNP